MKTVLIIAHCQFYNLVPNNFYIIIFQYLYLINLRGRKFFWGEAGGINKIIYITVELNMKAKPTPL